MHSQHQNHEQHAAVPQLDALNKVKDIEQQIKNLQQQAELLMQEGRNHAIASARSMIAAYHLKPEELGFAAAPKAAQRVRPARPARATLPAKYRDPESGRTWTGQGNEPKWIRDKDRAEFLISKPEAQPPADPALDPSAALPHQAAAPHGQAMP